MEQELPFLSTGLKLLNSAKVINLLGGSNDQITTLEWNLGYIAFDLNEASTGILTRVDNNQGISFQFDYGWTKPKPGVPNPLIVLKSLQVVTAGLGIKKTEFNFEDPQINLATGRLLGFGRIETTGANISIETSYFLGEEHAPKATEVRKQDKRVPDLVEVENREWGQAELDGIGFPKLLRKILSYLSSAGTTRTVLEETLDYHRLCPSHIRKETTSGVLETLLSYFDSRACLKANETLVGPDFVYTNLISYNQAGLPTSLELAAAHERLPKMTLGYDEELNLKNVTQPGKGTTFLHYDPVFEILSSLQFPDGTYREMTGYSASADAVSGLSVKGSGSEPLNQTFVYDEFYRLKEISNNFGKQSQYSYRLPNQTFPGILSEAITNTTILSDAGGEILTTGKRAQHNWYFEPLNRKVLSQGKEYQIDISSWDRNPLELTFQELESAQTVISATEASELFGVLAKDSAVNSNHRNYIQNQFQVDAVGLKTISKENKQYITQSILDLSTSQPLSFTDELNQTYTYERDVSGRLRKITLPDGNAQTVSFDGFGRVANISRSNVGDVIYAYDNTHDRLANKTILGTTETYEYDAAGRMTLMTRASESFQYSYEGSSVTGVKHADFTRNFSYTPDDKPKLKRLTTKSGLSIELNHEYDGFRNLIEQNVSNKYTKHFVYDDYKQLGLVRIGNQTFSIVRNKMGKVSEIGLPNNQTFHVEYDPLTYGRIGHSSPQGSYHWHLNDRGLINNTHFSSSTDTCDPNMLSFVYAADKTLLPKPSKPNLLSPSSKIRGLYDENRHRIGKYKGGELEYIRFEGIVATPEHIYEKLSIEGIDLGILIDGKFHSCLFDQVGSLLAIDNWVSIPAPFGERQEYWPIFEYFDYAGHGRDPDTGHITMGERDYDPRTHQFTSPDRFFLENPEECVRSPQECDLFSYAKNNPLIYTDPTGRIVDIALDIGFIAFSAYELYKQPNVINAVALSLDIASAAVPFVTGAGRAFKAASTVDKTADLAQLSKEVKTASKQTLNPLEGTRYTEKVYNQMRLNPKTALPDNHAFPRIVDNYAGQGLVTPLKGGDGVIRTKVELQGTYNGRKGSFEWIIEGDRTINHRLFVPQRGGK
jgi:RHS repeat-associated protein